MQIHPIKLGEAFSGLPENVTTQSMEGAVKMEFHQGEVITKALGRIGIVEIVDTLRVKIDGKRFDVMVFPEAGFKREIQGPLIRIFWVHPERGIQTIHFDLEKGKGAVQRTVNGFVEFWFDPLMLLPA